VKTDAALIFEQAVRIEALEKQIAYLLALAAINKAKA
jgi:hypothetical protein